jgi:cyclin-dependent kinase 9
MINGMNGGAPPQRPAQVPPTTKTVMNLKEKQKYIENFNFQYCAESSKYEKVAKIGQGTFG